MTRRSTLLVMYFLLVVGGITTIVLESRRPEFTPKPNGTLITHDIHVPEKCLPAAYVMLGGHLAANNVPAHQARELERFVEKCGGRVEVKWPN